MTAASHWSSERASTGPSASGVVTDPLVLGKEQVQETQTQRRALSLPGTRPFPVPMRASECPNVEHPPMIDNFLHGITLLVRRLRKDVADDFCEHGVRPGQVLLFGFAKIGGNRLRKTRPPGRHLVEPGHRVTLR